MPLSRRRKCRCVSNFNWSTIALLFSAVRHRSYTRRGMMIGSPAPCDTSLPRNSNTIGLGPLFFRPPLTAVHESRSSNARIRLDLSLRRRPLVAPTGRPLCPLVEHARILERRIRRIWARSRPFEPIPRTCNNRLWDDTSVDVTMRTGPIGFASVCQTFRNCGASFWRTSRGNWRAKVDVLS